MAIGPSSKDYWLLRIMQSVENAIEAQSDRSRVAHLELARHYWSMHLKINGHYRHVELDNDFGRVAAHRPGAKRDVAESRLQHAA